MNVLFFSKGQPGNALVTSLRAERFNVSVVRAMPNFPEAAPFPYDLVVVDVVSLGSLGIEIVREVRMVTRQVPILVVGRAISLETKLLYFELGIDDFLVSPVVGAEFLARARAALRRLQTYRNDVLIIDELRLDRHSHRIFWRDQEIYLTNKEYLLLEYLMAHAEKVVTREELAEKIWHTSMGQTGNTVDVFVRQLRRKIDDRYRQKIIHTVRGHGYMVLENGAIPRQTAAA